MAMFSKCYATGVPVFIFKRRTHADFWRLEQVCMQKTIASVFLNGNDSVWSPDRLTPRAESNDGTVLPQFDPVWSPRIRSAKMNPTSPD